MSARESARDRGERHASRVLREMGTELRDARLAAGLSQMRVARASGLSQPHVSRVERGTRTAPRLDELSRHAAVLGLRLSLKLYPEGTAVRDAGQLRLIGRFRVRVAEGMRWRSEVPVGGYGDLRAWDVVLDADGSVGVDAETRLHDIQAVQRRCETKWRDSGVDRIVLLVAATPHNRAVLREHRLALASTFPLETAEVMASLRRGEVPPQNGIVVL